MADKVLDADYIKNLLNPQKAAPKQQIPITQFAATTKPDPLHLPQVGYEQPGDKGDIWAQWIKQKRTGAAELIERWG